VVLRSACTTTTGVALPNLMTNLKTISQETGRENITTVS